MAPAQVSTLRARLTPPAPPRPVGPDAAASGAAEPEQAKRAAEMARLVALAGGLFAVPSAALVLATPAGLAIPAATGRDGWAEADVLDVARRLFEALAAAPGGDGHAGAIEELVPGRGFRAATALMSPSGRCLGALWLGDPGRRALLSGLQRRLLAEYGALVAAALEPAPGPAPADDGSARLREAAEAEPGAFALFDPEGRCLLRNARFDALVGTAALPSPRGAPSAARGREASWIASRLDRGAAPVGVYRSALADETWLTVEERRGPHGRSLLARMEERDAFGGTGEMRLLFERCPLPMFVFERDSRAILAVNEAALALYGWDRDAFLRLGLDGVGPVAGEGGVFRGGTHRRRDGRPLRVSGRAVALAHGGRPAVLVTVAESGGEILPA